MRARILASRKKKRKNLLTVNSSLVSDKSSISIKPDNSNSKSSKLLKNNTMKTNNNLLKKKKKFKSPLLAVNKNMTNNTDTNTDKASIQYFTVLFCKRSNKKHKTYEDGVLKVRDKKNYGFILWKKN